MSHGLEGFHREVISGERRGIGAALLRGALAAVEPVYAAITSTRNAAFRRGYATVARAGRPVISVGNITTGGTGKTPVVRWLAERLAQSGHRPAILTRGYRGGDELRMLQRQLGANVVVHANPSRADGARDVLERHPQTSVFILDDGFQHRRLARDFDLVLIDATNPFGFGHVLPRGLLREPIGGLRRAGALLITRSSSGPADEISRSLSQINPAAPVYRCDHVAEPLDEVAGRNAFLFCGIGNPESFRKSAESLGARIVGSALLRDHHQYSAAEIASLGRSAASAGAELLLTTEKDWVKVEPLLSAADGLPRIVPVRVAIRFSGDDEASLLRRITESTARSPAGPSRAASGSAAPADAAG